MLFSMLRRGGVRALVGPAMACAAMLTSATALAFACFATVRNPRFAVLGVMLFSCCGGLAWGAAFLRDYRAWRLAYLIRLGAGARTVIGASLLCMAPVALLMSATGSVLLFRIGSNPLPGLLAPLPYAIAAAAVVALGSPAPRQRRSKARPTFRIPPALSSALLGTPLGSLVARELCEINLLAMASGFVLLTAFACGASALGAPAPVVCWVATSWVCLAALLDCLRVERTPQARALTRRYRVPNRSRALAMAAVAGTCATLCSGAVTAAALAFGQPPAPAIASLTLFSPTAFFAGIAVASGSLRVAGDARAALYSALAVPLFPLALPFCALAGACIFLKGGRRAKSSQA